MICLKTTVLMRQYIRYFRYDSNNNLLLLILVILLLISTLLNLLMILFNERDNLEKCVLAFKDIIDVGGMFSCLLKRFSRPEESIELTHMIEEEHLLDRYQLDRTAPSWAKVVNNYKKKRKELKSMSNILFVVSFCAIFGLLLRYPMVRLLESNPEDQLRGFPTPFVSYIPPEFDQISFVAYVFILHFLIFIPFTFETFTAYTALSQSVKRLLSDYENIYILLDDIKHPPGSSQEKEFTSNEKQIQRVNNVNNEEDLRKNMRLIVNYHQFINRSFEKCVRCSEFPLTVLSFLMIMDSCLNIYFMMQAKNPNVAMSHGSSFLFNNLFLLLCYYSGQQICNQNEIFRRHVAELPWINKPKWFKQSLLIMMNRANVDTEMKPYGIFVLNLTSYKDLMKAAFSFGNILYTKKNDSS